MLLILFEDLLWHKNNMPSENQDFKIIFGCRTSPLAQKQADLCVQALRKNSPFSSYLIKTFSTMGDKNKEAMLRDLGGKGVFCREIDRACLMGDIDIAVHSAKDMPAILPKGLTLAAVLERGDPRDVLISKEKWTLETLPLGAHLGTASLRRHFLMRHLRPDLKISPLRGNVQTRIDKMESGHVNVTLLAAAGIQRLGYSPLFGVPLEVDQFIPAVGQGIIALVMRQDHPLLPMIQRANHQETQKILEAERAFLKALDGTCEMPIGAHAQYAKKGDSLILSGMVGDESSQSLVFGKEEGKDPEEIGKSLAETLKKKL